MKLKSIFATIFMVFTLSLAVALPPGGLGPGGEDDEEDPDVPIDGGIGILLVAGAAYGAKKVLKKK